MEFETLKKIIQGIDFEYEDWDYARSEYLDLIARLKNLNTLRGFNTTPNAREQIKYLRKMQSDFQFTDFGRTLVYNLTLESN